MTPAEAHATGRRGDRRVVLGGARHTHRSCIVDASRRGVAEAMQVNIEKVLKRTLVAERVRTLCKCVR